MLHHSASHIPKNKISKIVSSNSKATFYIEFNNWVIHTDGKKPTYIKPEIVRKLRKVVWWKIKAVLHSKKKKEKLKKKIIL